jgi:RimJ/RimL family protein N-acetyltransferase
MEYFPSVLSHEESNDLARRIIAKLEAQGWGLWAASVPGIADFIGFIGLAIPSFEAHFTPTVEVGWRLAFDHWGNGYATEGAKACLRLSPSQQCRTCVLDVSWKRLACTIILKTILIIPNYQKSIN